MKFEIITPQGIFLQKEIEEVQIPAKLGYMGILEGHTPFFAMLGMGEMWYRIGETKTSVFVNSGYFDVLPNSVSVLAEEIIDPIDLDFAEVKKELEEQEKLIEKGVKGEIEVEEFHKALHLQKKYQILLSLERK
jgi:F-type H+-transporting ATPase subunit epsilon